MNTIQLVRVQQAPGLQSNANMSKSNRIPFGAIKNWEGSNFDEVIKAAKEHNPNIKFENPLNESRWQEMQKEETNATKATTGFFAEILNVFRKK